jgi:hypothetical protein
MGYFRFHRSIGNRFFRLNLSKTGISGTLGEGPAHLNIPFIGRARRKPIATFSAPGTGLSYRETLTLRWLPAAAIGLAILALLWLV